MVVSIFLNHGKYYEKNEDKITSRNLLFFLVAQRATQRLSQIKINLREKEQVSEGNMFGQGQEESGEKENYFRQKCSMDEAIKVRKVRVGLKDRKSACEGENMWHPVKLERKRE